MTEGKMLLLMLKGTIAEAPKETQGEIEQIANRIRAIVKEHGDEGAIALALVGAEVGAANE